MLLSYIQFKPIFGDIRKNLAAITKLLAPVKTDLVVLPELCTTGYLFSNKREIRALAEPLPDGETARFFIELSRQKNTHIIAGIAERDGNVFYNSAVITGPEGYIGTYRKVHLYAEEKKWFKPGNKGFDVYKIKSARVGVMICFDWIFPESARTLALKGADIIAHPSNLVLPWCQSAMRVRSIENRIFTVTANRIGRETRGGKSLKFTGKSQMTGMRGEILAQSGNSQSEIKTVSINPQKARNKSLNSFNDLFEDRRTKLYM
ncbi:MAG: acyltransferase [Planctomycetes bacterium]|nr:acyltransferase [Planctomycetota bacterium]